MDKVTLPVVKDGHYGNAETVIGSLVIPAATADVIAALFESDLPIRLGGSISLDGNRAQLHAVSIYAANLTSFEAGWQACKREVLKELAIFEEEKTAEMKIEADFDNISAWESLVQSIKDCRELVETLKQVQVVEVPRP